MKAILAASLFLAITAASAAEVAGVKIDDRTRVGNSELTLNGAGLRRRAFFQVYAIGLYLPQKAANAAAVLDQPGPKRVSIHMLRDVGADAFTEALADGIRANHSEAETKALEPRVKALGSIMAELKEAKKGMAIALDWNGKDTILVAQGEPRGQPIPGEDFYRALLSIWLGDDPVDAALKRGLLGPP
jgi:hypothetical protein